MTKLTDNFSLEAMTRSSYAKRHGIDNSASAEIVDNLMELCEGLERVRRVLGDKPMYVSSGYRNAKVNAGIGGSPNSYHQSGLAADFTCPDFGTPAEVCREILKHAADIGFDKLILEYDDWTHIQFPRRDEVPRMLAFTIRSAKGGYLPGIVA